MTQKYHQKDFQTTTREVSDTWDSQNCSWCPAIYRLHIEYNCNLQGSQIGRSRIEFWIELSVRLLHL